MILMQKIITLQEEELVTRLQQVDCHLPLQERILGGSFSPGSGGMRNATKLMASVACIRNSGVDCLWAWLLLQFVVFLRRLSPWDAPIHKI